MKVTIIGTGNMARGIGTRVLAGGHAVTLVGTEAGKAEALATELQSAAQGGASVQASSGAALEGDVVVLAVPYAAAASLVQQYADQLAGNVIVDITNPVDFSTMSPAVAPSTSGLRRLPRSRRQVRRS